MTRQAAPSSETIFVPLDIVNNLTLIATGTPDTTCCGGAGTVHVVASGGNGVYTYKWSPAVSNSTMAAGLAPGIYSITVTDGNGLTAVASAMVEDADDVPDVIYEPSGIEALCLPIPFILHDDVGLAVNGVPYTGPFGHCDLGGRLLRPPGFVKGYGYADRTASTTGAATGCHCRTSSSTTHRELADIMNFADPFGYWVIDPDTKAIYGGDIDQVVYGQMKITHLKSHIPYIIGVNYTQFAYGTGIMSAMAGIFPSRPTTSGLCV